MDENEQNLSPEKCARCLKVLGFNHLSINQHINEWLCLNCSDLYILELQIFNKEFIEVNKPFDERLGAKIIRMRAGKTVSSKFARLTAKATDREIGMHEVTTKENLTKE